MPDNFDITSEEARLLLEIGLMATGQNRFRSATSIIMAVDAFRSGHESIDVAKAVLCLSQRQFQEGLDFIEEVALKRHPESGMLKTFQGMALMRLNRKGEASICLNEARLGADPAAARLAQSLLDEL